MDDLGRSTSWERPRTAGDGLPHTVRGAVQHGRSGLRELPTPARLHRAWSRIRRGDHPAFRRGRREQREAARAAGPARPAEPARAGGASENGGAGENSGAGESGGTGLPGRPASTYSPTLPHDDDEPKPLYREDPQPSPATGPEGAGADALATAAGSVEDDSPRPITFTPRRPRAFDDDSTTILPRTRGVRRPASDPGAIEDFDDHDEHRPLSQRTKLSLLIGSVAAVVVIGLAIGYAVLGVGQRSTVGPTTSPTSGATEPASPSPSNGTSAGALLTDELMLSPAQAKALGSNRTWKTEITQRGESADAPRAACFGDEPAEGQPVPQQTVLRVLSSSGKQAPSAFHAARAYSSPEEAVQAFAVASKTLGGCALPGSYIAAGQVVTGVGDQAVGVIVRVAEGSKVRAHSVLLSRTGQVMNVVDASTPGDALGMGSVAKTVSALTAVQCQAAGGTCGGKPAVKNGPPPLGGDEPGFLAFGDLPPAGPSESPWVGTAIEVPKESFVGSGCEVINWATVPAVSRSTRVYLISDSGKSRFGLNEIVLTLRDEAAATKLVAKIKADVESCKKRKLTASVTKPATVTGVGAQSAKVSGWTSTVTQKSADGTLTFRVGAVSAGPKVAYTFLTPEDDFDLSESEWNTVAVRAGQRTTQVN